MERLSDHKGRTIDGRGKISAFGVDVIEGGTQPPIAISFDNSHHVTVHSSSNVQIGTGNVQGVSVHIQELAAAFERSNGSAEEKAAAKNALQRFVEHPAVTSILGGLASAVR